MALFQPVANPIPCFKGVHEGIRSVMVSMTNLHMRIDYAQRAPIWNATRHPSTGCVMYLLLSHKGVPPLW